MKDWVVPLAAFQAGLAQSDRPSWQGLTHGSMRTFLFSPGGRDVDTLQALVETRHSQDELYIVTCGECAFSKDGDVVQIKQGDVVFVESGADHRFERYSDDFSAWVVFWGPAGGEA